MRGVSASTRAATYPLPLAVALALLAGCSGDSRGARIDAPRATASAATPASAVAPPNTVSPPPPPKAWSTFRELVMTPEDCKAAPRASITRAEAMTDAAVVERIVRRGWAGLEVMTRSGVDFAALFAELAHWIADAPEPIAVGVFHVRLVQTLHPAADNHMAFFEYGPKGHANRRSVGRHVLAYTADLVVLPAKSDEPGAAIVAAAALAGTRLVECEGHALGDLLKPTVAFDAAGAARLLARPIVLAESPPPPLRCRVRATGGATTTVELPLRRLRVNGAARAANAPPAAAFERRDGALPFLTVRTFWTAKEAELAAFVASGAELREAKAIVVDLRGNGGGSDTYAKDWLAQLTNQTLVGAVVDRLDSDVTRQGIVNDNTCELAAGIDDEAAFRETNERLAYGRRVVDEAEAAGVPLRVWKPRTVTTEGRATVAFTAPLVSLVDNVCASACESFVSHARQLSGAVVVGENTGGVGIFGEVLVYRLPKSGLGMSAGMKYFHDPAPSREVPEGRGHLPDYWLDSEDAAKDAVRIAECLSKPACALRRK